MNPTRPLPRGFANPLDVSQAPDFVALGFATQADPFFREEERKEMPPLMPSLFRKKVSFAPPAPELPKFGFGEVPTFDRQQNNSRRGWVSEAENFDGRMASGDLAYAFATLGDAGKTVPAPLSEGYQGSPYMYGALYGLPPGHITNGSRFIEAYGETLKESHYQKKAEQLIAQGYDQKRVLRVLEEHLDDEIKAKLTHTPYLFSKKLIKH